MKKLSIFIVSLFSILSVSAQYNRDERDQNARRYERHNRDSRDYNRDNRDYNRDNRDYNRDRDYYNRGYNNSVVTLTMRGNNTNERVLIDGQSYTSGNYNNGTIQIDNLQPGQHSLQVVDNNGGGGGILGFLFGSRDNTTAATTFNLRSGYDMNIIVNANGRARIRETRDNNYNTYNQNYGYRRNQYYDR